MREAIVFSYRGFVVLRPRQAITLKQRRLLNDYWERVIMLQEKIISSNRLENGIGIFLVEIAATLRYSQINITFFTSQIYETRKKIGMHKMDFYLIRITHDQIRRNSNLFLIFRRARLPAN